jgi:hypothetical protein
MLSFGRSPMGGQTALAVSTLKPRDFELMSSALHQDPITLTAAPCFDLADDGRRIRSYAKRGPLFDAKIADRIVVRRNAQPLLDACRVLMAEGCNPATPIVMRHEGSVMDALRTTVGHAAKLTVDEPADGKRPPRFRDWRPRDMGDDSSPPIAPGD